MVEAFGVQDTGEPGAEIGQTARLRAGALPARPDRNRAAATDADIEVQPVLRMSQPGWRGSALPVACPDAASRCTFNCPCCAGREKKRGMVPGRDIVLLGAGWA